jgi:hypothetical protein
MFLYIPFLLRLCRFVMFLIVESEYPAFALSKKGLKAREAVSKESQHYVQSKAPGKTSRFISEFLGIDTRTRRVLAPLDS